MKILHAATIFAGSAAILITAAPPAKATFLTGDLNRDNAVDMQDLLILGDVWLGSALCEEQGLAGHWRLDEASGPANDTSGSGRTGILHGDAAWLPYGGKVNGALALDGDGDYVQIDGYTGISGGAPRTCTAWIKTAHTTGIILAWGKGATPAGRWIVMVDPSGFLRVEVGGGYVIGTTLLADNLWHHVAVVSDTAATDGIRLYVDGRAESPGSRVSQVIATVAAADVKIGAFTDTTSWFHGRIDDVRIYDRALTADEVWAVAATGTTNQTCQDLDGDGSINLTDLSKMAENWRKHYGPLLITEFMADNESVAPLDPGELLDGSGEASDWIEIHNPTATAWDLEGWRLTDDADDLAKWSFPADITIQPGEYLIVFASGKEQQDHPGNYPYVDSAGYLHTNFKLSADGEYLALVTPEGLIAHEYVSYIQNDGLEGFPPQEENVSYGLYLYNERFFSAPTPGRPNDGAFMGYAQIEFSVPHGFYDKPFQLALSSNIPGATIRYTADGSTPSESVGTIYNEPLTISRTTALRAIACKPGYVNSPVVTQTYIFISDVINQSPNGEPPGPGWPTYSVNGQMIDYGMDPQVTQSDARYKDLIDDALLAIPSFSIVTDLPNLFDPAIGIYVNAERQGRAWERPASFEIIYPDGTEGFQINGGLRIRGGFSRQNDNPKHAFRLFFREEYGPTKLRYPLFGDEGADEFDCFDLRTSQNYSWGFQSSPANTMLREVFQRDAQREMGQPYTRSRYYHLYINGHYWGLYMTQERAEASFGASYFGGDKEDYDVIKHADNQTREATDGNLEAYNRLFNYAMTGFDTNQMYYRVLGRNPDGTVNPDYDVLVDQDSLIVYMLGIFYSGDGDAPISSFMGDAGLNNFYCINSRVNGTGFKFFRHDGEHTLDMGRMSNGTQGLTVDRTGPWTHSRFTRPEYFNPQTLHEKLMAHPEYRMRFADLAYKAFFNGGVFTPEGVTALMMSRAKEIETAIIAESARWGDAKSYTPLVKAHWENVVNNILKNYFPYRTQYVLNQLIADGWYPTVGAPSLLVDGKRTFGGQITASTGISMTGGQGTIYYTTDGTDPREPVRGAGSFVTLVRQDAPKRVFVPTGPLQSTTGSILAEYWHGITGETIAELTGSPNYPDNPSASELRSSFEIPTNWADTYGTRVRGYLRPAQSGNYRFWIASDDHSQLWLSTDDNPMNVRKIAEVVGWTDPQQWNKYSSQQSGYISLTAGQRYYIEALHKEGSGGDNLAVAWRRGTSGARTVIAGQYLSPAGGDWEKNDYDDSAWILGSGGVGFERNPGDSINYTSFIGINVEEAMYNRNATCYIRIPFTVNNPALTALTLRVRYDDGFVAWINGSEVARKNFTGTPAWNSAAEALNADGNAVLFENFDLTPHISKLRAGSNLLAIQGLNVSTTSSDFLISVELTGEIGAGSAGGGVSPTAANYATTGPVTLDRSSRVKARLRSGTTWGPLEEAVFAVGPVPQSLRITEIMYNPPGTPEAEFIELANIGAEAINLNLCRFTNGVDFTFGDLTLAPGERTVVVNNRALFEETYPDFSGSIAGEYIGSLDNMGERITLVDPTGQTIHNFTYLDTWYDITDGGGFSLTIKDPTRGELERIEGGLAGHWKLDEYYGATAADASEAARAGVVRGNPKWRSYGGKINGAIELDGAGSYVEIPDYKGILGGAPRTCAAWIKTSASGVDIVGWGPKGVPYVRWAFTINQSGRLAVEFGGGFVAGTTLVNDDKWHHVAAVLEGPFSDDTRLYVDGRPDPISTLYSLTADTQPGPNVGIGTHLDLRRDFRGLIDNVLIYDRALTADEVALLGASADHWEGKQYWRPSAHMGGSPGQDDTGTVPELGAVVINEILAHSHGSDPDWIELYNTTDEPIDISGWFLSDDNDNYMKFRITAGTVIEPHGYVVFYENQHFNNAQNPGCLKPFALSENGETLYVRSGLDANNNLTGYYEEESFDASETGVAFGRYRKSTGTHNFVAMSYNTPGAPNAYPKVGPIVISEIMYNPPGDAEHEGSDYEFVELCNISDVPVTLQEYDPIRHVMLTWRFTDAIEYTFPLNTTIPPGGFVVVAKNPQAFTARYGPVANVFGPYGGKLANEGEKLEISMPGDTDAQGTRYYIRVDRVNYSDSPEWPQTADGEGDSLTRINLTHYGNDPANWHAAPPTPGQ